MDFETVLQKKQDNINQGFVEEHVKDIEDIGWRTELAVALDNQRLINEQGTYGDEFNEFSIPTTRIALKKAVSPHLVSFQCLLGPHGLIYHFEGDQIQAEDVVAKTRLWKTRIYQNEVLDPEVIGQALAEELDREIFYDLINHAGQRLIWDISAVDGDTLQEKCRDLAAVVKKTRQVIKAQSKREEANWLVTSPTGCRLLALGGMYTETKDFESIKHISPVGNMWDMRVFCDPRFPTTTFLLGYRGTHFFDSGYFYCPYLMLTPTPVVEGSGKGFIIRYAKKMMKAGSNYYAKIEIDNF